MMKTWITRGATRCALAGVTVCATFFAGGCAQVLQTALAVPMVAAKVAEVPLRHTEEMTRIAASAASDTTKTLVTESIRASTARQVAAENARAQIAIAQVQAQSQGQSQVQSQARTQVTQQLPQHVQTPAQPPVTTLAAAPRVTSSLPSMSVIDVQSRPAPTVAAPAAQPAPPVQTALRQPPAISPSARSEQAMSLDDLREAQRRAAMQRMAQMESRHNWY